MHDTADVLCIKSTSYDKDSVTLILRIALDGADNLRVVALVYLLDILDEGGVVDIEEGQKNSAYFDKSVSL